MIVTNFFIEVGVADGVGFGLVGFFGKVEVDTFAALITIFGAL